MLDEEIAVFPSFGDDRDLCVHIRLPDTLIYYIFDSEGDIVWMNAMPRDSDSCSCGLVQCGCAKSPHVRDPWHGVAAYNPSLQRTKVPGPPGMPPGYEWYHRLGMFVLMGGKREEMRCQVCGDILVSYKPKKPDGA